MAWMTCRVRGCKVVHQDTMLACKAHWYELPRAVRDEIWSLYRSGPSDEHRAACFRALEFLNAGAPPMVR